KALGGDLVTFVATARPGDAELDARIAAHRRARPRSWRTMEADADLADAVARSAATDVILLDSLTLWVAALVSARETGDRMWPARSGSRRRMCGPRFGAAQTRRPAPSSATFVSRASSRQRLSAARSQSRARSSRASSATHSRIRM